MTAPTLIRDIEVHNESYELLSGYAKFGTTINFTLTFDQNLLEVNAPALALSFKVGNDVRQAPAVLTEGRTTTFSYVVTSSDLDTDGIEIVGLVSNGGVISSEDGGVFNNDISGHIPDLSNVKVDGKAPAVERIVAPAAGAYGLDDILRFEVVFDEDIIVSGSGGQLGLRIASFPVDAEYVGHTANSLLFEFTIVGGLNDAGEVVVRSIDQMEWLQVTDAAGNGVSTNLDGKRPSLSDIVVDTQEPSITKVFAPVLALSEKRGIGHAMYIHVQFDEAMADTADGSTLELVIGTQRRLAELFNVDGNILTFRYVVQEGDLDTDGIAYGAITAGPGGISDLAGNPAILSFTPPNLNDVLVDGVKPYVTSIDMHADGVYKAGDTLTFAVNMSEPVKAIGAYSGLKLELKLGEQTVYATARAMGLSSVVHYDYTIKDGDLASDGIELVALVESGARMGDAFNNSADLRLPDTLASTANIKVDGVAPTMSGPISVPAAGSYSIGDELSFALTFDEDITVTGSDSFLELAVGSQVVRATYAGTDGNTLTYVYTVASGDMAPTGIAFQRFDIGTTRIQDAAGNDAVIDLVAHPPVLSGILVDSVAPAVQSVTVPFNGTYVLGQMLYFSVIFDEAVTVNGADSALALTIGNAARQASFVDVKGATVRYAYTVQNGDLDNDGITIGALALGTSTITDAAGNAAATTLSSVASTAGVRIDGVPPKVDGDIQVTLDGTYRAGATLSFTVNFDKALSTVSGNVGLALTIGATTRLATLTASDAYSVTFAYTVQAGDLDTDGIAIDGIALNGAPIRDLVGNMANLDLTGHLPSLSGLRVDARGPSLVAASVHDKALVLQLDDSAGIDVAHLPGLSAFTVTVDGVAVDIDSMAIDPITGELTLTLAQGVAGGQVVSVSYADPGAGDDANALQDNWGNDMASFTNVAVANLLPAPAGGNGVRTQYHDGVPVAYQDFEHADGSAGVHTSVDPVPAGHQDPSGTNRATVPLADTGAGTPRLSAQLASGMGLYASGAGAPVAGSAGQAGLLRDLQLLAGLSNPDLAGMQQGAEDFVRALGANTPLLVHSITPTGRDSRPASMASASPMLAVNAQGSDGAATALLIDTRSIAPFGVIGLSGVQYGAIFGSAIIDARTSWHNLTLWGDSASQHLFAGSGNDVLHAGGGNDTLHGGAGNDWLDGGSGQDVAVFSGSLQDYSLRMQGGQLVLTDTRGFDGVDTLVDIETVRFLGGYGSDSSAVLRHLYEGLLQRSPSAAELSYWQEALAGPLTLVQVAREIASSAEALARLAGVSDSQFVEALYQEVLQRTAASGEIDYWTGVLAGGADRASVALGFATALEAAPRSIDIDQSAVGVLVRMYHAMFGRAPDEAGLNYWLGVHEQGVSIGAIADGFAASRESVQLGAANDHAGFIDHLFLAALGRAPSATEKATLLEQLDSGVFDQGQVLLNIAESPEHVALVGVVSSTVGIV